MADLTQTYESARDVRSGTARSRARAFPQAPQRPPHVPILDVPMALIDYDGAMDWMDAMVAAGEPGYMCVAAVHTVTACRDDADLRQAVLESDLTVPDGQPLVWAINALGHELHDRVYGPELMTRYCQRAAASGTSMYLYGGRNQGALVQLALNLRQRHPGLRIVGGYSPPYRELTESERARVAGEINASGADVVWVGIGVPKQEKWMAEMRDRLEPPVLVGVGAAFDLHAGIVPQAPQWMQDWGLEWLFRFAHEPRRLGPRYVRYNPRFLAGFARQYRQRRLRENNGSRALPR